jgi:hypothetical protein
MPCRKPIQEDDISVLLGSGNYIHDAQLRATFKACRNTRRSCPSYHPNISQVYMLREHDVVNLEASPEIRNCRTNTLKQAYNTVVASTVTQLEESSGQPFTVQ